MSFSERLLNDLPAELLELELPCAVRLPENTLIVAGCRLGTLLEAIGFREEMNVRDFREPRS